MTPALDRIAVASMQVQDQSAPMSLRVSAPPTFTMRWLIPRLSGFQRLRPEVETKLTLGVAERLPCQILRPTCQYISPSDRPDPADPFGRSLDAGAWLATH